MADLIHVIHAGAAARELSEHDTVAFLNQARNVNRAHDISGLMLYVGGCLLILLEGEAARVGAASRELFSGGREMRMILREPIVEREFPEWILGFETVEPLEAAHLIGAALELDPVSNVPRIDPSGAKTLLSIIGRRRWQSDRSGMFRAIRRAAR